MARTRSPARHPARNRVAAVPARGAGALPGAARRPRARQRRRPAGRRVPERSGGQRPLLQHRRELRHRADARPTASTISCPSASSFPLKALLAPVINGWLQIPLSDQTRGDARQQPLAVAGQQVAVNICYEDVFGEEIIRQLPQATLLVNVTNDAWCGDSFASEQHLQISQMRALETGRYMLRATNTGVTAVIDHRGRVLAQPPGVHRPTSSTRPRKGATGATPYRALGKRSGRAARAWPSSRSAWRRSAQAPECPRRGSRPKARRIRAFVFRTAMPAVPRRPMLNFQDVILTLQNYWGRQGCALLQPYDMEVGAGTFHTATFLRALGPEPWRAAYVQPSRRPKDGRYGENPNRLQHYYQYQVVLKPSPADIQDLYLDSLRRARHRPARQRHPLRRGRLGIARRSAPGAWAGKCGSTAWRSRSSPTSRRSAASTASRCWARSPTGSSAWRCTCRASTTSST